MNKKLPKLYVGKIERPLTNNESVYYGFNDNIKKSKGLHSASEAIQEERRLSRNLPVNEKIIAIFNSPEYVYKATVRIRLRNDVVIKQIIGKNNKSLITIDNELIPISDIIDINFAD